MEADLWQLGLALGLAVDAGLALALALSGRGLDVRNLGQYVTVAVSITVICWAGLSPLVWGLRGAVAMYVGWDEWKHRNDEQPAALLAAEPAAGDEPVSIDPLVASHRWRVMCHRFLVNADRHGFAIRGMVDRGVVSWEGWGQMTAALASAGVLVKSPRAGWAPGWDMLRWEAESRSLPWPESTPPEVQIGATNNATTLNNRAGEVIEGIKAE